MLIGVGLLLFLKLPFWPMILVVVGIATYVREVARGRIRQAFSSTIWLFGIAFLISVPRLLVPGLIILVGVSILLNLAKQRTNWP